MWLAGVARGRFILAKPICGEFVLLLQLTVRRRGANNVPLVETVAKVEQVAKNRALSASVFSAKNPPSTNRRPTRKVTIGRRRFDRGINGLVLLRDERHCRTVQLKNVAKFTFTTRSLYNIV